jgi:flagellin-like hook-associated protein FlgL
MRISPYVTQSVLNALSAAAQAEETALLQLTTGKPVNVPSDDPSAAAREVDISSLSGDCD